MQAALTCVGMTDTGIAAMRFATAFLERHEPAAITRLLRVTREVHVAPDLCGPSTTGCVHPTAPWVLALSAPPEWTPLRELLATLVHEPGHVDVDDTGRWHISHPHRCSDGGSCRHPIERAYDRAWSLEDAALPAIDRGLALEGLDGQLSAPVHISRPPPAIASARQPSPAEEILKGAAIGGAIGLGALGFAALLDAILSPPRRGRA